MIGTDNHDVTYECRACGEDVAILDQPSHNDQHELVPVTSTTVAPADAADETVTVQQHARREMFAEMADAFVEEGDQVRVAAARAANVFHLFNCTPAYISDAAHHFLGEELDLAEVYS